eukprot:GGOE01001326.1.p1 GENE.GGOE01001326.1~~GGOE01001326.1.p1  ORF type:complete len:349 (+),score=101.63 GGOE01001326.1:49-1095(+)
MKPEVPALVLRLAQGHPIHLSIRQLRAFTLDQHNLVGIAQHLHRQVPICLARRVVELDRLFPKLRTHPNVQQVQQTYLRSLEALLTRPTPRTVDNACTFATEVTGVVNDPDFTRAIERLCTTVQEMQLGLTAAELAAAERTLHHFYTSRLSTRIVVEQFFQMSTGAEGLVTNCSPYAVVQGAIEEAKQICLLVYGARPAFRVTGDEAFRFLHLPGVLHLIVKEVVKNSCRATMEALGDPDERPISIDIATAKDDVVIRISDKGGGFPRELIPRAFSYVFTTVKRVSGAESPYLNLAGYGRGLPLARLYCEYFGGALHLLPIHGQGTDCYIYISRNVDHCASTDSLSAP